MAVNLSLKRRQLPKRRGIWPNSKVSCVCVCVFQIHFHVFFLLILLFNFCILLFNLFFIYTYLTPLFLLSGEWRKWWRGEKICIISSNHLICRKVLNFELWNPTSFVLQLTVHALLFLLLLYKRGILDILIS